MKTLEGSKAEDDNVLSELGIKQLSHKFGAVDAIKAYSLCDISVAQTFRLTLEDKRCPISVLNVGSYIQSRVASTQRR